ncbi:NmrA family NAD(P)-binding protein [Hymenobacter sp. BT188]|uniref:NmrA family NAD(P)-binding protein n=1 Tax=Hymenobacter sp. BT188 TaxID=2763504 RepID=UPI001651AA8E|nr:NmrA family NAD(P)-binding protein [Hymenobacter sp. BT188]MBC6607513.1 NmrA family NAD(P)-binding protein [Hymenobacter sp. BT188]
MAESTTENTTASSAQQATIVLAGATGDLGGRIAKYLLQRGANVRALVRAGSGAPAIAALREQGATIIEVDFNNETELTKACVGATCVVSALSGLREVIVEMQTRLLQAAGAAGVPRFIPSDYCIDYTKLPVGSNRNLDLRREFAERLDKAPIQATSILNGMFTDLLTGQAPVILFKFKRVVYWGNADQPLDFTTTEDTAAFTAAAALDATTPRFLRVAGEVATIRGLQAVASAVTGEQFRLFRVGGLGAFGTLIKVTRALMPTTDDVFPPWQGMQYMHNMFSGRPKLEPLDNARYPDIRWTPVREVLANREQVLA